MGGGPNYWSPAAESCQCRLYSSGPNASIVHNETVVPQRAGSVEARAFTYYNTTRRCVYDDGEQITAELRRARLLQTVGGKLTDDFTGFWKRLPWRKIPSAYQT